MIDVNSLTTNEAWFAAAQERIPGGVNSPVRAFRSVGGTPYFVDRAEGPYVWDVEGRRYIDMVQSYGAVVLGHASPVITEAVVTAVQRGTSYGAPTPREVQLADEICSRSRPDSSGELRHRGHNERDSSRPWPHWSRSHREVRRQLSRSR
jgi:glutamate-1-semialdehyde aminotransferase